MVLALLGCLASWAGSSVSTSWMHAGKAKSNSICSSCGCDRTCTNVWTRARRGPCLTFRGAV
ncbi:hypothetical protein PF005_g3824 [Phytophthora fragariae]|uniref:Secreted protein n=2 Tax=Phytophthora TaxID=4783 RepID=A0A6A4AA30_9STRA|nr:hypothetical protein PF003_g23385 [Phytophthora fragariae]KAE9045388.1 hypothetical protein PR002_g2239 [Phytophthora rubi]KAE8946211.1 hypothetical protein PF009_g4166 [Phytophthora fragariae]KAE9025478.1 hypothetical protein PF011_g3016 [Phytophthora fragariae]KAE9049197.1 hypothetical protein PR001_g3529 [Phytophthora rubi]